MNYKHTISYILLLSFMLPTFLFSQEKKFSQQLFSMAREKMTLDNDQLYLFNGRGFASPCEFGMTAITNLRFFPVEIWKYQFNLNFIDDVSKIVIQDDTPFVWEEWQREGKGWDPCGANFRPGAPMVLVPQRETWEPNNYYRKGVFHKQFGDRWVSFGMETWTSVSHLNDEVFLKVKVFNRDAKDLKLTIVPQQKAPTFNPLPQSTATTGLFTIANKDTKIEVSADIASVDKQGFHVTIPTQSAAEWNFSLRIKKNTEANGPAFQPNMASRIDASQQATAAVFDRASEVLPMVQTDCKLINDLYDRSILTLLTCRYTRPDYKTNPFFMIGNWPFATTWDNSFAAQIMGLLDAQNFRETIKMHLSEGKMKSSYMSCYSDFMMPIIYLNEPFALQNLLEAYLLQTGDWSIMTEKAGEHTVFEWLKLWVKELRTVYTNPQGFIDLGYSTEKIIEIRTDGYNHVVPIMNLLSIDFYRKVSEWGKQIGDSESAQYLNWSMALQQKVEQTLWNEKEGWYDNLYPDGTKRPVWTFHIFDVLNKDYLDGNKRMRMISHLKDGEFLGEYGLYSIALHDSLHYDKVDSDWGGGGQYAGAPMRIAKDLYQSGNDKLGWDILKRFAGYTKTMPYISQNPSTDKPHNDKSSMSYQISGTAAAEAVLFGLFGLQPTTKDVLIINPSYNKELGTAYLKNYKFRGSRYDVTLTEHFYEVYKNGLSLGKNNYGKELVLKVSNM